jgi:hypothetical protein
VAEDHIPISNVGASRDGHQFHEAWAARIALELLPPGSSLSALAIEGFSVEEPGEFSAAAHEIADLIRYRGGRESRAATRVEVLQFKYSVASASEPMRAAEMAKTVRKFAAADQDFRADGQDAPPKGHFELVTNRPIDANTSAALAALRTGTEGEGRVADHARRLAEAAGLSGEALRSFALRLALTGAGGSLGEVEHANLATLASWAGATDSLSHARLANLRRLVRDRAGSAGQGNNIIGRIDVLGAIDVASEEDLYPVRAAFPPLETPIERPVLEKLVAAAFAGPRALLVHAAGGVGKTVLMQALTHRLSAEHIVLTFDGFGAGMWREPSDSRHLPRKALPHLANLLAAEGLCDLLLPASFVEDSLVAFRKRLEASVAAARQLRPGCEVILVLDAIDHCGMIAARTHTQSFAHLVLQSLNLAPIAGVRAVASCRSHRRADAQGEANCREFEVPAFTREETQRLVLARAPTAASTDVTALHRRCGGNPRILDTLLRRGPPFDRAGPEAGEDTLDALLREQIEAAQERAIERGATPTEARGLLAGMALLPPPVPADELAGALGLAPGDVESFVADLFPLIEPTPTGLIFRDEPTETLVTEMVEADGPARSDLVARLQARQDSSVYAARALPGVLVEVGAIEDLVALAFIPPGPADLSRVARRAILQARLHGAAIACASRGRIDDLTRITLEASRVSSATERSDTYLRGHPDLVALSGDAEAVRRFRDDRQGWPGSRHAALAVLDVFAGDMDAAALESGRALTWFNWWVRESREGRKVDHGDIAALETHALFVQLLLGHGAGIDRFLRKLGAPYAFELAAAMLALAVRCAQSGADDNPAHGCLAALETCQSRSPPVLAAILQTAVLPPIAERRLIMRLARIAPRPPEPRHYGERAREDAYAEALVAAAGRAVRCGLVRQARAILRHAPLDELRAHAIDDPWPLSGRLLRHLQVAAVHAAKRKRPTSLVDLLPDDMAVLVPEAVRRRGPAAFEKRFRQALAKATNQSGKRSKPRKNEKLPSSRDADRFDKIARHRLAPLVPFVDLTGAILRDSDPAPAIAAALAAAEMAIAAAETYPYRDQARFLARVLFGLVRWAAGCRGALDRDIGERIAESFAEIASPVVGEWLETIALLAREPATHAAALRLARGAEAVIAADTGVTEQIAGYGALARALLAISADEARPYFRIGLELADAVGSDDQERIGEIIAFAAEYQGAPLAPRALHDFVRLCEVNFPDDGEAVDWRRFAAALAAIGGATALAPLARLADRDKVDLGWTLPPLLKVLTERGRLDAGLAVGLVGLAECKATWNWSLADVAAAILPRLVPERREAFAQDLLAEIDRSNGVRVQAEELAGFNRLFSAELPSGSPARQRIAALAAGKPRPPVDERRGHRGEGEAVPAAIRDALDISSQALRAAIDEVAAAYQGTRPTDGWILRGFVTGITDPAPRVAFLKAVAAEESLTFSDKADALEEALETWTDLSRALAEQIEATAIDVALRGLDALAAPAGSFRRPLAKIARIAGSRGRDLVLAVIAGLAGQSLEVSSDFWMSCAIVLARSASDAAIGAALARHAALTTEALPDRVGDGPWSESFTAPDTPGAPTRLVADLLWLRLGAPEAAERWRAAHALRRLAVGGADAVLAELVAGVERVDAGVFQDLALPFFHLNARMWLLIAMARIAKEDAARIAPFGAVLETIAASSNFPHVVCRHFAILALGALADAGLIADVDIDAYRVWLAGLNRPELPPAPPVHGRPNFYSMRPKGRPEPDPPFRFEYDFDKYQVDPLGRVFGLPKWDVEDAAIAWLRRFDPAIRNMWDCPRPRWNSEDRPWGSASAPEVDLYGGQLAWHAVLLAAGQFAATLPVRGETWERRPWQTWFEDKVLSRLDGFWLADGTDLFPLDDRHPIVAYDREEKPRRHVPPHPLDLLPLAGLDDSLNLPEELVVGGSWQSFDRVDVSVGSVLVPAGDARAAALAVYSAEPFFAYLPSGSEDHGEDDLEYDEASDHADEEVNEQAAGDEGWDGFEVAVEPETAGPPDRRAAREKMLLKRWLAGNGHAYTKLDAPDPYGFNTALGRVGPDAETAGRLGLVKADPFGRSWTDTKGASVFRAEAWGNSQGRGRHRSERGGTRLTMRSDALRPMLAASGQALLMLVKLRKYLEKPTEDDHFRHQMLALIVRSEGPVEVVWSVPKALRDAIGRLGHYERGEFADRLAVIEALGRPRRQSWPRGRPRSGAAETDIPGQDIDLDATTPDAPGLNGD